MDGLDDGRWTERNGARVAFGQGETLIGVDWGDIRC